MNCIAVVFAALGFAVVCIVIAMCGRCRKPYKDEYEEMYEDDK